MSVHKSQTSKNIFPYEIVFNKYKIQKKLGKGSFGTVYMAENKENGEKVAIKTEINTNKNQISLLEPEAHKLHNLKGYLGIPKLFNFTKLKDYNILAMELLGKSLNEIFSSLNKKFSLKTVCTLGIDMIKLIKYIHEKNLIHRDIKPDNFMMGINKNKNILYLIDFGLSKKYINSNGNHIEFKLGKNMTGTARYCSIYTHQGIEQSRRDDLESIGYVLIYFLKGNLPWQNIQVNNNEKHFEKIGQMKQNISIEELCSGFPYEFVKYFEYVKQLEFDEDPNYNMLIELFQSVLKKNCGVKYINSNNSKREKLFDWNYNINNLGLIDNDIMNKKHYSYNEKNKSNKSNNNYKKIFNDSSFNNNIKDTKDDTKNFFTEENEVTGKNKDKDIHCQCFIF